jgi:hypothetical protein
VRELSLHPAGEFTDCVMAMWLCELAARQMEGQWWAQPGAAQMLIEMTQRMRSQPDCWTDCEREALLHPFLGDEVDPRFR